MKLHTAGEDYLEAVLILQKKLGMVRSVDVARYMEVSKPSVCYAVGTLREGGFLTTDENHYISNLYYTCFRLRNSFFNKESNAVLNVWVVDHFWLNH